MARSSAGRGAGSAVSERLVMVDDLEVWVLRKRVKNMRLHVVPPQGRIEVSVPPFVSDQEVCAFVRKHRDWVIRHRRAIQESPMARAECASEQEKREWKQVVQACAVPLVERWARILNVKPGQLAFRSMKSRWGSCQPSTGRICLNTRLALYPPECLEYVVVHELCHLRVKGHTTEFWALVETCLPDYKKAKQKLK